jgi:hypothetical protein
MRHSGRLYSQASAKIGMFFDDLVRAALQKLQEPQGLPSVVIRETEKNHRWTSRHR